MTFTWFRRLSAPPRIPDPDWEATLAHYRFLAERPPADIERLRQLTAEFLREKEFHGAHGFVISDEVAIAIAAQAVLPVLHLEGGIDWYDDFIGVVVHPSEAVAQRKTMDDTGIVHEYEEIVAGEAMDRGPIMLSWEDVHASSATHTMGYNVVIHEFAHKLDMRSGEPDGCPPLPPGFRGASNAPEARAAWFAVRAPAYEAFREQTIIAERFGGEAPWLDAYGAQSIDEFFAVACEAYFVNRQRLAGDCPELISLFDAFFMPQRQA
jgi:Mlc titration factor MtfA (ptsG expression regulator)